jgi:hypothetical protein
MLQVIVDLQAGELGLLQMFMKAVGSLVITPLKIFHQTTCTGHTLLMDTVLQALVKTT